MNFFPIELGPQVARSSSLHGEDSRPERQAEARDAGGEVEQADGQGAQATGRPSSGGFGRRLGEHQIPGREREMMKYG